MVSPMLEKNVETDKHAEVAADKNAQVATGKVSMLLYLHIKSNM